MKKLILFIFIITTIHVNAQTQPEPNVVQNIPPATVSKVLYTKEQTLGFMVTTSGWGINYRSGKAKGAKMRQMVGLEFSTYRHPKEIKIKSVLDPSQKYRYGKEITPYFLRGSIGIQKVVFDKETPGAIQVRYLIMGGPTLVLAKPYYVDYKTPLKNSNDRQPRKFDAAITSRDSIYGRSSFFTGAGKTIPYPAVHLKTAISFEYASESEDIKALEIGATLDYLPIPLRLFSSENRRPLFLQLYVSFNFGSQWY
jgi:hypothetical protein